MKNVLKITLTNLVLLLLLLRTTPVHAQYGSTSTTNSPCVSNDLKVRALTQTKYYDNLEMNTYLFKGGDLVEYSINIENNRDVALNDTKVSYSLPTCSTLIYGPNQKEASNGNLSWTIPELKAKEAKSFTVRARLDDSCTIKKLVAVSSAKCENGSISRDNAVIYIGKLQTPQTGPEDFLLKTLVVAMLATGGIVTRKLIRGY